MSDMHAPFLKVGKRKLGLTLPVARRLLKVISNY